MSAIVGFYYLDGRPAKPETLGRMVDTLAHRGPDGKKIWLQGAVGLGHQMLWTTPESLLEHLPLVDPTGDLVLTADARIDNRSDLISTLALDDRPTEKITDSQLILAAYQKWGERCPDQLIGDFAFALWDGRKHQLFCARDHFGIKPFYYYRSDQIFAFASEIKALLCVPGVPRQLNELMVGYHLTQCFEDKTITFYQDIWRLSPAHSLTINHAQQQPRLYWSLDPKRELQLGSDQAYVEAFREVFTEAVRCRLRSAFPVGSSLSGGLDSSSIACTARQLLGQVGGKPLHTFSAIFPSLPEADRRWIDERQYMDAVKALGGFQAHDIRADLLHPLIDSLWQGDEAILAPNLYIHQAMYQQANQQGVRVFLDGFDGDSTVSYGIGYLAELLFSGRWHTLLRESTALAKRYRLPRRQVIWKYCLSPILGKLMGHFSSKLGGRIQGGKVEDPLIDRSFAQRSRLEVRTRDLLKTRQIFTSTCRQDHWLGLTGGLNFHILDVADKITSKFSLEARYPFFDKRLIELCLAMPPNQKLRQGWMRFILRASMTGVLPPEVQWRLCKGDLSSNFGRQISAHEQTALTEIAHHPEVVEPYIRVSSFRDAYDRYTSTLNPSEKDRMTLFSTAVLDLWLRQTNLAS